MIGSLFAAVSGLAVHQRMLEVVGQNLANLNTTGFKSEVIQFSDLVYQTLSAGSGNIASSTSGTS